MFTCSLRDVVPMNSVGAWRLLGNTGPQDLTLADELRSEARGSTALARVSSEE